MKFRGVKSLLEWYVYRKENPISSEGAMESTLRQLQGDMATFGINACGTPQWVDAVHAIVDIEKMLSKFPRRAREALLTYGVYDKTRAILHLKEPYKRGKKTIHWGTDGTYKYFNRMLASFYNLATENDYIINPREDSKKFDCDV